jgi:hypothetical protein
MTTAFKNPASQGRTGFFVGRKIGFKKYSNLVRPANGPNHEGCREGKNKDIYIRNCEGIFKIRFIQLSGYPLFFHVIPLENRYLFTCFLFWKDYRKELSVLTKKL